MGTVKHISSAFQSSLKPGTVISGSQVIRIPANQSIVANANQLQQLQMPGGQVIIVIVVKSRKKLSAH